MACNLNLLANEVPACWSISDRRAKGASAMSYMLRRSTEMGDFGQRMQHAELDYLVGSRAASTALAENYDGLLMESTHAAAAAIH